MSEVRLLASSRGCGFRRRLKGPVTGALDTPALGVRDASPSVRGVLSEAFLRAPAGRCCLPGPTLVVAEGPDHLGRRLPPLPPGGQGQACSPARLHSLALCKHVVSPWVSWGHSPRFLKKATKDICRLILVKLVLPQLRTVSGLDGGCGNSLLRPCERRVSNRDGSLPNRPFLAGTAQRLTQSQLRGQLDSVCLWVQLARKKGPRSTWTLSTNCITGPGHWRQEARGPAQAYSATDTECSLPEQLIAGMKDANLKGGKCGESDGEMWLPSSFSSGHCSGDLSVC